MGAVFACSTYAHLFGNAHIFESVDKAFSAKKYGECVFFPASHFYGDCRQNKKPTHHHLANVFIFHNQMSVFLRNGYLAGVVSNRFRISNNTTPQDSVLH